MTAENPDRRRRVNELVERLRTNRVDHAFRRDDGSLPRLEEIVAAAGEAIRELDQRLTEADSIFTGISRSDDSIEQITYSFEPIAGAGVIGSLIRTITYKPLFSDQPREPRRTRGPLVLSAHADQLVRLLNQLHARS